MKLRNQEVASQLNELTKKMHNVEVTCNHNDNLALFGKIEDVQRVVTELCSAGLRVINNDIPEEANPYYTGHMVAVVGKL